MPIGNLTSQLFANIYLNELDVFAKHTLRERYYIRYTDDFVFIHKEKEHLEAAIPILRSFLKDELGLDLHPQKIILRKFSCGIDFLGYVVLPYYRVLRIKTKNRMMRKIYAKVGDYYKEHINRYSFFQTLQSYLGVLRHCRSQNISNILRRQLNNKR